MSDGGRAILSHSLHGLAATGIPSRCRSVFARVLLAGDVPVGDRRTVDRQTEDRLERHMAIKATVATEDEFVEARCQGVAGEGRDTSRGSSALGERTPGEST